MDKLEDLPVKNDTVVSPQENNIMDEYFGGNNGQNAAQMSAQGAQHQNKDETKRASINWKLIGYSALIFVLLANPWVDGMFEKMPYCSNTMLILALKVMIFIVAMVSISYFA